jgi:hypothetical protein
VQLGRFRLYVYKLAIVQEELLQLIPAHQIRQDLPPMRSCKFFSRHYPTKYWQEHDVVDCGAPPHYLLTESSRDRSDFVDAAALRRHRRHKQMRSRTVVAAHIRALAPSAEPGALVVASQNAQIFNQAYPKVAPLEHPALSSTVPHALSFARLGFELNSIERANTKHGRDYQTGREQLPPPAGKTKAIDKFLLKAEQRSLFDIMRIESKYADLQFPLKAVTRHAAELAAAFDAQRNNVPAAIVEAVQELLRTLRHLKQQGAADLIRLEQVYLRAAPIMREAADIRKRRPDSAKKVETQQPHATQERLMAMATAWALSKRPALLDVVKDPDDLRIWPNLFGPGTLHKLKASQVERYTTLCRDMLKRIEDLRRLDLGPVTAELRLAIAACLHLLRRGSRSASKRYFARSSVGFQCRRRYSGVTTVYGRSAVLEIQTRNFCLALKFTRAPSLLGVWETRRAQTFQL